MAVDFKITFNAPCLPLTSLTSTPLLLPSMAKPTLRHKASPCLAHALRFLAGSFLVFLLLLTLPSFFTPINPATNLDSSNTKFDRIDPPSDASSSVNSQSHPSLAYDPPDITFYDDPKLSYSIEKRIEQWDEKRHHWLKRHPSLATGAGERVLLLSASQPAPCPNPIGDHLLLRFFKNKVDYCRIHGYDIFYNNALLHPEMFSYWAKLPVVRAAMIAHPEAEWIWWVDSDALFTDMEFKLPLDRYKNHNFVAHGWAHLIYDRKSWTALNAGVFLIRNCQWSMDFMDVWASMGPQTPNYEKWGQVLKSTIPDKQFPESDDQTGLVYLLYKEKEKWGDKIYLEGEYYFEGYWAEIVGTFDNITERYTEMEREAGELRRRHAEKVSEQYGAFREKYLRDAGSGKGGWRRPFITHFTGCQPCSGDHNQMYSGSSCWDGMLKALNFADNQVLRKYGFRHLDALNLSVSELPYDYPA